MRQVRREGQEGSLQATQVFPGALGPAGQKLCLFPAAAAGSQVGFHPNLLLGAQLAVMTGTQLSLGGVGVVWDQASDEMLHAHLLSIFW